MRRVREPALAAATAAQLPKLPPPMTTMSAADDFMAGLP
jgi:hypothetical protein